MSEFRVPEGWIQTTLGENLQIDTGSKNAEDSKADGAYPFFTRAEETQKIDTYSYDTEALFIAGEGNFRVKYYNGKFEVHQRTYILRKKTNEIDLQFLQKAIQPQIYKLISTSVGSTVKSLRKPQIAEIGILIPKSNKEQKKIAEILSEVDNAITLTKELIEKNKRLKTALMQDLLSYGIDENGQIRTPQTHKFKPSPLGDIPVEWESKELIDITSLIKDGTHGTHKDVDGGIPLLSAKDIKNGKILIKNDSRKISKNDFNQIHKNYQIEQNDILISIVGTIGEVAIVKNQEKFTLQRSVAIIRFKKLIPKFIYYSLIDKSFYNQLLNSVNASAQGGIYLGALSKCYLKFPKSKTEQQKIADILSSQDEKIEKLKNKLTKLNHLKTSLMQDLLSGEVRVNKLLESKQ